MTTNWRTNLGGAISVTGTSLIGVGVLPQLLQLNPESATILSHGQLAALWYVALAGFILSGLGKGFTALFAADATVVNQNAAQVKIVSAAVDKINQTGPSSDTALISKPVQPPIQK